MWDEVGCFVALIFFFKFALKNVYIVCIFVSFWLCFLISLAIEILFWPNLAPTRPLPHPCSASTQVLILKMDLRITTTTECYLQASCTPTSVWFLYHGTLLFGASFPDFHGVKRHVPDQNQCGVGMGGGVVEQYTVAPSTSNYWLLLSGYCTRHYNQTWDLRNEVAYGILRGARSTLIFASIKAWHGTALDVTDEQNKRGRKMGKEACLLLTWVRSGQNLLIFI